uniref:Uncharacterized protein n=1 Tax=Xenopus tropicalis TaxID=8364 RepID=A0A1B8Y3D1_XENTR
MYPSHSPLPCSKHQSNHPWVQPIGFRWACAVSQRSKAGQAFYWIIWYVRFPLAVLCLSLPIGADWALGYAMQGSEG